MDIKRVLSDWLKSFFIKEIPEVQKVADRCVVFYEGEIAAILDHKDVTEQVVMAYSTGAKRG